MMIDKNPHFLPAMLAAAIALVVIAVYISHAAIRPSAYGSYTAPPAPVSPDGQLHFLSGRITAVGGSTITVEAELPGTSQATAVVVRVASSTTVELQTQKDLQTMAAQSQVYQSQLKAYRASAASSTPGPYPTPPLPFTSQTISFDGLSAGMFVNVTPVAGTRATAVSIEAAAIAAQAPLAPAIVSPAKP